MKRKAAVTKAIKVPPARKIAYKPQDFKKDDMVLVYLKDKKGVYLAQVLRVWMPNNPYESEEWIRLHRLGKERLGS